jgi:uncharacterized protein (DUF2126 family)
MTRSTSWRSRFDPIPRAGREPAALAGRPAVAQHLVDVTGNTHRTEICIDKLYSPDGPPAGWAWWNSAVRDAARCRDEPGAAIAAARPDRRFWREPYQATRLVRWGTDLHDRFMLPKRVRPAAPSVSSTARSSGCRSK